MPAFPLPPEPAFIITFPITLNSILEALIPLPPSVPLILFVIPSIPDDAVKFIFPITLNSKLLINFSGVPNI